MNILYIRLLSLSKISNFFVFDWEDNHVAWNYVYLMPFESYNVKNTTLSLRCIHFLVEKPPETWIYVGEVVENMGCLIVRSVGTTILNSCLKGSWLMQLVNYWEIPGKKKKKELHSKQTFISTYHLTGLLFKGSCCNSFWQRLCKTEAAVSDKGFIYLLLLSVDFWNTR